MIPGIRRHHFTYLILYSFVTAVGRYVLINSYNRTSDTSICDGIALVAGGPAHQTSNLEHNKNRLCSKTCGIDKFLDSSDKKKLDLTPKVNVKSLNLFLENNKLDPTPK